MLQNSELWRTLPCAVHVICYVRQIRTTLFLAFIPDWRIARQPSIGVIADSFLKCVSVPSGKFTGFFFYVMCFWALLVGHLLIVGCWHRKINSRVTTFASYVTYSLPLPVSHQHIHGLVHRRNTSFITFSRHHTSMTWRKHDLMKT